MTKEQIIEGLNKTVKELGYAAMYVEKLKNFIESDCDSQASDLINDELEEYLHKASPFGSEIFGVNTDRLQSEIQNYFDDKQYARDLENADYICSICGTPSVEIDHWDCQLGIAEAAEKEMNRIKTLEAA